MHVCLKVAAPLSNHFSTIAMFPRWHLAIAMASYILCIIKYLILPKMASLDFPFFELNLFNENNVNKLTIIIHYQMKRPKGK